MPTAPDLEVPALGNPGGCPGAVVEANLKRLVAEWPASDRSTEDAATEPRVLTELFGGQGTLNVPSWAPDSRRFAFVSYRLLDGRP